MSVSALKQWHWVVIALVLGLIHGTVRQAAQSGLQSRLDDFAVLLTDARLFETALVTEVQGRRLFRDVVVYPYQLGPDRNVHLVTGRYWNGRPEMKDGQPQARWESACFIAPIPYRTQSPGANPGQSVEFPSVVDYLATLQGSASVQFKYAWWWWATEPLFASLIASLLLIGFLWPMLINLYTFGTLRRPREAKGLSLWNVKGSADSRSTSIPGGRLSAEPAPPVMAEAQQSEPEPLLLTAPILNAPPAEAAIPAIHDEKKYGSREDDFYPTELHDQPPDSKG